MANIAIFRINYKSDFILTLNSDAGWLTPFCIKFWTGAPSQAYFVGFDGTTYTHCAPVAGEPTKLLVQFDDHHLPIGDLKFQIGYHFTVADFPTSVEDEVINQASVIIEVDGAPAKVMLDLNGETAPEIEFSLPAYANEAQRIENEQQRIENEQQRIDNEQQRIDNEQTRQRNEEIRIENEQERVREFGQMKGDLEQATRDAAAAAENANEKAVYAKNQGDYAKQQGDTAKADHERAEDDHRIAGEDHTQAGTDHTRAGEDHTQAGSDHTRAGEDHTRAGEDHTRAESDHTRAESDHAAVEVYVDSLGAFDISAYHATGGVLAKYADLTTALGTNGANVPDALRKGGMSVKFVQSSDNKYVQFRLMADEWSTTESDWQGIDDEPTAGSDNLVKSGGVQNELDKKVDGRQDSKAFYVTDDNRNIIAKIDKDGVHSVDFKIGEEGVSVANALGNIATQISNAVAEEENRAKEVESTKLDVVLNDNTFYLTDTNGYIICKIDAAGVHSVNIDEEPNKIDSDSISIEDSNGYIIARIDKDGIHCAKNKHAVACMVLSESYYPIATPTRDSDGNITYVEVMFETGIAGSLTITYTNGNPSSVAVVYGNYNYTITINRDTDGNVETVSVN